MTFQSFSQNDRNIDVNFGKSQFRQYGLQGRECGTAGKRFKNSVGCTQTGHIPVLKVMWLCPVPAESSIIVTLKHFFRTTLSSKWQSIYVKTILKWPHCRVVVPRPFGTVLFTFVHAGVTKVPTWTVFENFRSSLALHKVGSTSPSDIKLSLTERSLKTVYT